MLLRLSLLFARSLHNGRLRLMFLTLIVMLICGLTITYYQRTDLKMCFMELDAQPHSENEGEAESLGDILLTEPMPTPGKSIFFHETSCHQLELEKGKWQMGKLKLTPRQACAIESAALHNPNFQVFVLFASPTYLVWKNHSVMPLIDAILSYKNVNIRRVNLWSYAAGTPIDEWVKDGQLFRSSYVISHISDFLRYLTLYRFGGLYLDMDVVVLRSMEDVPPNYTGAESTTSLAAGVMNLAPDGFGHEIADLCLRNFQKHFDGSDWGNNGPGVITRVAEKICGTKVISLMVEDHKRCLGFKVFERNAFYAVPWREWRVFFEPTYLDQTMARTKDSYVAHVWNKHSKDLLIKVGSKAAYAKYAEQNCPKVFAATGEYF
ncbi:lactosylceramide 4-alpha-galactosyltransferase [Scaptodrosophila lebanonensis]|uniref:Lactosylceramide 4-alpha-galactosyltransferase n=1 Tax=Drosophila lebanonensis TaxID=7225 RepID=A0A6J2U6G4_DROLE|nr:lactosylceramide 4-alpha-galactosyltransferase [Scaptodrosophila lebanonensis]